MREARFIPSIRKGGKAKCDRAREREGEILSNKTEGLGRTDCIRQWCLRWLDPREDLCRLQ